MLDVDAIRVELDKLVNERRCATLHAHGHRLLDEVVRLRLALERIASVPCDCNHCYRCIAREALNVGR